MQYFQRAVLALLLCLPWGCATMGPPAVEIHLSDENLYWPSEALQQTFTDYWGLRAAGRYDQTFAMEAPYLQETVPRWAYLMVVDTKENRLEKVDVLRIVEEHSAYITIGLNLFIQQGNGEARRVYLNDQWVKVADTWYHVIKDPVMRQYFP